MLNYLGYSWVDRGEHLDKAKEMLNKAVELQPDDGFIVDSLGWAYYRLGDYGKAVTFLERAVELEPADPVINDHLGDAYWRAGRQREARFQWQRALTFHPETERRRGHRAEAAERPARSRTEPWLSLRSSRRRRPSSISTSWSSVVGRTAITSSTASSPSSRLPTG